MPLRPVSSHYEASDYYMNYYMRRARCPNGGSAGLGASPPFPSWLSGALRLTDRCASFRNASLNSLSSAEYHQLVGLRTGVAVRDRLQLALALVSGSSRGTSHRTPLVTGTSFQQLSNSLVGESQNATGVAHRQVSSPDQVCDYGGAHSRSLSLQYLCLAPHLFRPPYLLLQLTGQDGFNPDFKGIGRNIQKQGDRVTGHSLGLFEP